MTKFLMCKPTHLHCRKEERVDNVLALKQHSDLVKILEENGAELEFIEQKKELTGMIFTSNAGLVYNNKFILPNFKNQERRPEAEQYLKWAREKNYKIVSLPFNVFFEGEADIAWIDGKNCFVAFGELKTNYDAVEALKSEINANIIPVRLVDERFPHLNTCLRDLDDRTFMYYRKAFDEESVKKIEKEASSAITLAPDEAEAYVCNSVRFGRELVMHICRWPLESYLKHKGYKVQKVDLSELRKLGGSARSMVLEKE